MKMKIIRYLLFNILIAGVLFLGYALDMKKGVSIIVGIAYGFILFFVLVTMIISYSEDHVKKLTEIGLQLWMIVIDPFWITAAFLMGYKGITIAMFCEFIMAVITFINIYMYKKKK